jgi:rare lipoprotein A
MAARALDTMHPRALLSTLALVLAIAAGACGSSAAAASSPASAAKREASVRGSKSDAASVRDRGGKRPKRSRAPKRAPDRRPALSKQIGSATYYADKFDGRPTASGEAYDPSAFTAAHRRLPFGSVVRVVRLDDPSRFTTVRINDRGPHGDKKRLIDLSRAAAHELDMLRDGIVRVRVEVLEYGTRKARSKRGKR